MMIMPPMAFYSFFIALSSLIGFPARFTFRKGLGHSVFLVYSASVSTYLQFLPGSLYCTLSCI